MDNQNGVKRSLRPMVAKRVVYMMRINGTVRPSAPECQLTKLGTDKSFETLLKSTECLTDTELLALEEDLNYYSETGLIGTKMSKLLALLRNDPTAAAA